MSEPKQRKLSAVMRATLEALPEYEHIIHRGATAAEIDAAGGTRRTLGIAQQKGWANTYGAESQEGHTPRYYRTPAGTEALERDGWTEPDRPEPLVHVRAYRHGVFAGALDVSLVEGREGILRCVADGYEVKVNGHRVSVTAADVSAVYEFPSAADVPEIPSGEFVVIPGLGRTIRKDSVVLAPKTVAPKPSRKSPTMSSYGFPHGRYEVDGTLYWFSFDRNLLGTMVRKRSGDKWVRDIGRTEEKTVAAAIAKDPKAALHRYSGETGSCGLCGRKLTNHESLLYGIGEKCARDAFGEDDL